MTAKLHDRQLEHDQPQPARHQKPRQLRFALAARKLQVSARAGEKHEHRRTEMCDPAREEQARRSCAIDRSDQTGRRRVVNKVARVVQHHDDHHDATQQIDRIYSSRGSVGSLIHR